MSNFPSSLDIPQDEVYRGNLIIIKNAVQKIWEAPLHRHYTRHDLRHSEKIIDVIGKLLNGTNIGLNVIERFILLAVVYLHDIGMQSPLHAGLEKKENYTATELETIREKHHDASRDMIYDSIDRRNTVPPLGLDDCRKYVDFIATVAQYHRKYDITKLNNEYLTGTEIRLPLLAALIRLGDELDSDCDRVNIDILAMQEIPIESKYHWWGHLYVQSVVIENGHIKLYFNFPEKYKGLSYIKTLRDKIVNSINKQFLEVYNILDEYGLRLYKTIDIAQEGYSRAQISMPIELEIYLQNINESAENINRIAQKETQKAGLSWYV